MHNDNDMIRSSGGRRVVEHTAKVSWKRSDEGFRDGKYSRVHTWEFDGGVVVPASASPHVVKSPWSSESAIDPEEAFVASVASCHMLTFLYLAGKAGWVVDEYIDIAAGVMTKNERNVPWVSSIKLSPKISFGGEKLPTAEQISQLHHDAHEQCFIANSVKTKIEVDMQDE